MFFQNTLLVLSLATATAPSFAKENSPTPHKKQKDKCVGLKEAVCITDAKCVWSSSIKSCMKAEPASPKTPAQGK